MAKPVNSVDDALKGLNLVRDLICPDVHTLSIQQEGEGWQIRIGAFTSSGSLRMAERLGLHRRDVPPREDDRFTWTFFRGVINRCQVDLSLSEHQVRRVSGRV